MTDVKELRQRVKEQRTFADAVTAFYILVRLPELTWLDLLDGLDHPGLIADAASINLHNILNIPVPPGELIGEFIMDRSTWEKILKEKGIDENQCVPPETAPWVRGKLS